MRSTVLGLAILALLAGCLDGDGPRHDEGTDQVLAAPSFEPPATISGGGSGETFIAVGADGLLLACGHGGFTGPSPVWLSRDDGATWATVTPGPNPFPDGDCDVEVSPAGVLAIVYDYVAGSSVAVSQDGGGTWTLDHAAAPPITGAVDRPWIGYVGERLLLSYKAVGSQLGIVVTRFSDDHGATWSDPVIASLADDAERAEQLSLDFLVGADGIVRIPLVSYDNDPERPVTFRFLVSRDQGASWTREAALGPLRSDNLVAAAVAGNGSTLYWAWHDKDGTLRESHATDSGATWSKPAAVATAETVWTPAMAGRADGSAALVWLQSGPDQAMAAELDAAREPAASAPAVVDPPNGQPQLAEFSDVAIAPDGTARVVYAWATGEASCRDPLHPTATCERFARQTLS